MLSSAARRSFRGGQLLPQPMTAAARRPWRWARAAGGWGYGRQGDGKRRGAERAGAADRSILDQSGARPGHGCAVACGTLPCPPVAGGCTGERLIAGHKPWNQTCSFAASASVVRRTRPARQRGPRRSRGQPAAAPRRPGDAEGRQALRRGLRRRNSYATKAWLSPFWAGQRGRNVGSAAAVVAVRASGVAPSWIGSLRSPSPRPTAVSLLCGSSQCRLRGGATTRQCPGCRASD